MKLNELRNKLILRSVIYLLVVGALIASYSFVASYQTEAEQKHKWLKNDINSLRSKINNLDEQKVEFANAVIVWEELPAYHKQMLGIQITGAEAILTDLYDEFRLTDVSTTFSKPALLNSPEMQKDAVSVEVSDNNTMSFSVYNDQQIYQFVYALRKRFPGYIKIKNININRVEKPSASSLRQISEGKVPALIRVSIDFTWYALKTPDAPETEIQEQPS